MTDESDCIYPDCMFSTQPGWYFCEHSCPHWEKKHSNYEPKETGDAWAGGFAKNH